MLLSYRGRRWLGREKRRVRAAHNVDVSPRGLGVYLRLPLLLLWPPSPDRDVELPPAGALFWAGVDEARGAGDERAGLKFRGGDCGAARGAEKLLRGALKLASGAGLLRGDEKFGAGLLNRGTGLLRGGDEKFALGAGLLNRGPTSLLRDPGEAFTFGKGDGLLIR